MDEIARRLLDTNIMGEFADVPASAQKFMQLLQAKLADAQAEIVQLHEICNEIEQLAHDAIDELERRTKQRTKRP